MADTSRRPSIQNVLSSAEAVPRASAQGIPVPPGFKVSQASSTTSGSPLDQAQFETIPEKLTATNISITAPPPRGMVMMHVYAHGAEEYEVYGNDPEIGVLHTRPKRHPNLALGEMVQSQQDPDVELPRAIWELLDAFSRPNLEIRKWLRSLRTHFGDQLYLIIVDHTDFEIPWEMLELTPRNCLGAVITTARWQHVIGEDDVVSLSFQPDECGGNIIAYVNHEELEGIGPELTILQKLNATNYNDINQFRRHLEQNDTSIGLIYMACHGIFDTDIRQIALGSYADRQQRLRLMEMGRLKLELVKQSRGIVFLNACHSGRLKMDDERLRDSHRRGFAELFLAKGARGVIGTLGGVGDRHAAQIAHDLMETCSRFPTMSIAAVLRTLRAEAVARIPDEPSDDDKDLLHFIYTFMYVYYGNPLTKLWLTKREG